MMQPSYIFVFLLFFFNLYLVCELLQISHRYSRLLRPINFRVTKLNKGADMSLVYSVTCNPPVDYDVVLRKLSVTVNNGETVEKSYSANTTNFGEFKFKEGDQVTLSLVDIDGAGNVSEPATVSFVAMDTIPPVAPTGLNVVLVRQEGDEVVEESEDEDSVE